MRCDMPDRQFLEFVNLDHPSMTRAKALAAQDRTRQAAREAARAMFAAPFAHPVKEHEIPALAQILNSRYGEQVAWLRRLADNYLLRTPKSSGLICGANREEEQALYRAPARTWLRRGDAPQALARLYSLTGKKKYLTGAIQWIRQFFTSCDPLPDDPYAGAFIWHPRNINTSHDGGHIVEKICHGLPHLRPHLKPDDALLLLKGLLAQAEFNFRTCRYDVTHNITLHMLISSLLVGLLFPAFKPARQWVHSIQKRIEEDFTSASFVTSDGYFGEGLSYQAVNHNLMFIALRYLQAARRKVSPKLRQVCQKSFGLAVAITRADGRHPELGDAHVGMMHEHYISHHEMLHLAATFFRRKDFKAAAGSPLRKDPLEHNIWSMGLEGFAWWDGIEVPPFARRRIGPRDLRASGIQILGQGAGPSSHFGLFACAAAHNHAHHDFASVDIYGLGRSLLTDTGVTSYGEETYREPRAHNTVHPVRRWPLGPRLDRLDHQKTLFVVHKPQIQAACMEHGLYEGYRIQRTVCLINAGSVLKTRSEDPLAFWLIVDHVRRSFDYPGGTEPHDFIEAYFHFNAPQTTLGYDDAVLTCWSRYDPADSELERYPSLDARFEHKPQRVPLSDYLRAYDAASSDANLQVTAIVRQGPHSIMDMRFFQGFTGEYGGRVKRPSMAYRWQGLLPYVAAYVLVPFRGLWNTSYAQVIGKWSPRGDLNAEVQLPEGAVRLRLAGLTASKRKPVFDVRASK